MAKKKIQLVSEEEMQELIALPPEVKLARLKYIEIEIEKTKLNIKDQKAAAKEFIQEMEAQRQVLMSAVEETPDAG
jgi:hypothetical protein